MKVIKLYKPSTTCLLNAALSLKNKTKLKTAYNTNNLSNKMLAMREALIAILGLTASTDAVQLLVASYGPKYGETGAIQTLDLQVNDNDAVLKNTSTNLDCGTKPSWLDVSSTDRTALCVNEDDIAGGLIVLTIKPDGSLEKKTNATTLGGPVSSVRYNNGSAVALAHYAPVAAVSSFTLAGNNISLMENTTFDISGSTSDRQKTSHMHQVVLDPTGQYILSPDLGGNVVQVFSIDPETGLLDPQTPLQSPAGAGPRHLTFWSTNSASASTFMSVVHELKNTITTYKVNYECEGLTFDQVDEVSTYGPNTIAPASAAAAEIATSPDNKFIMVSNRQNPTLDVQSPEPGVITKIKSDSLATFKLEESGKLTFVELHASGGLNPRHFSLNSNGTMVAVANQVPKMVVIWVRNATTGKLSEKPMAAAPAGPGDLTNVQWI